MLNWYKNPSHLLRSDVVSVAGHNQRDLVMLQIAYRTIEPEPKDDVHTFQMSHREARELAENIRKTLKLSTQREAPSPQRRGMLARLFRRSR